jgi:hypothetical protein
MPIKIKYSPVKYKFLSGLEPEFFATPVIYSTTVPPMKVINEKITINVPLFKKLRDNNFMSHFEGHFEGAKTFFDPLKGECHEIFCFLFFS